MKKRLIFILLALCLLVSGCEKAPRTAGAAEGIRVYRQLPEGAASGSGLLESELLPETPGEEALSAAIAALEEAPTQPNLQNPLPPGLKILDAEQSGSHVWVSLDTAYLDLPELQKTLISACITLTLCSLEGVDFVSIGVGGEPLETRLSSEDFLLFDTVISAGRAQTRIYFPRQDGGSLGAEYKTINIGGENSVEREILDALFGGPTHAELRRPFPDGTVVLSVYTINGTCSVSLSGLGREGLEMGAKDAELAVYAVVNSLASLAGIKNVQILIDGQPAQNLWGFNISAPLQKNEEIIGSSPERG